MLSTDVWGGRIPDAPDVLAIHWPLELHVRSQEELRAEPSAAWRDLAAPRLS